ncbi:meiotic recombination protein REC8 homolog [Asterias rubens]|uniref:meiotic recombination protein REC8 homolog n=1 Tax=Asterias rubens TaxID=7604 RepID=UPI001455D70A|nr:meiotic recombination protein REC8 homolog [Asterias rubens]
MFFSQDILKKRGGKFGIVWIAATKCRSVSLSKRDYFTVSISKTCDDIMKYVCLKAEPVKHHGAHPRLSLYLSSQLMFGVAKVYEKQIDYFSAKYRMKHTWLLRRIIIMTLRWRQWVWRYQREVLDVVCNFFQSVKHWLE